MVPDDLSEEEEAPACGGRRSPSPSSAHWLLIGGGLFIFSDLEAWRAR